MKHQLTFSTMRTRTSQILMAVCTLSVLTLSSSTMADTAITLIDDFNDDANNSIGLPRQYMNDTMVGGNTTTELSVSNGVMQLSGEIVPPRGQPGWASAVLLLDGEGKPVDASEYSGIRMRVKINSGMLSISANSTEVTNFDYHSSVVMAASDGEFHDVKIPFSSLKRSWSEQTFLNTQTINSLSLVAFSIQKASFDYAVDEVSFY